MISEPHYLQPNRRPKTFFGWEFDVVDIKPNGEGILVFWGELLNPEAPNLIQSYRSFRWDQEQYWKGGDPLGIKPAAAWLVSHWYEHALNICECTGAKRSRFRDFFIATLLYLNS